MRIAYFGLPLGACLLRSDGHELELAVLSPLEAPGRRRLSRLLGEGRIFDALEGDPGMDAEIEARLESAPPDLISRAWVSIPAPSGTTTKMTTEASSVSQGTDRSVTPSSSPAMGAKANTRMMSFTDTCTSV